MIENMKHAIGLDYRKPKNGQYEAYRNCFVGKDRHLDFAVKWGLADMKLVELHEVYNLTDAGFNFIGKIIGAKIVYPERTDKVAKM